MIRLLHTNLLRRLAPQKVRAIIRKNRIDKCLKYFQWFQKDVSLWKGLNDIPTNLYVVNKPGFHSKKTIPLEFEKLVEIFTTREPKRYGDLTRLYFLVLQTNYLAQNKIPGAVAEVGVYKGTTAKLFRELLPGRELHLFDTFEGFHKKDLELERDRTGLTGLENRFADTSLSSVQDYVGIGDETYSTTKAISLIAPRMWMSPSYTP